MSQGSKVEVVGMTDENKCLREMFVEIVWDCDTLAVPLSQLEHPIGTIKVMPPRERKSSW